MDRKKQNRTKVKAAIGILLFFKNGGRGFAFPSFRYQYRAKEKGNQCLIFYHYFKVVLWHLTQILSRTINIHAI